MISWFARFKNRFEKLQKYHKKQIEKSDAKIIEKSSKNQWKMEPKSIKKPSKNEVQKMMQKGCQKGLCPLGAGSPLEGSLLRREQYRKTTNKQKKQQREAAVQEKGAEHVTKPNTPRAPAARSGSQLPTAMYPLRALESCVPFKAKGAYGSLQWLCRLGCQIKSNF